MDPLKGRSIPLVWVGLGLLLGTALYPFVAGRKGEVSVDRERAYRERIAKLESTLTRAEAGRTAGTEARSERIVEGPAPPGAATTSFKRSPDTEGQEKREPRLTREEIRALIRKGDRASSVRAALSIAHLEDLPTELALVRELFFMGDPAARYAALVVGDSERWPPEAADLWCVILREGSHSEFRSRAAKSLARLGNPVAIPALEEALQRGDLEVQKDAAIALETLGRSGARDEMIARLVPKLGDPDGSLRRKAVVYMGELGTAGVLPHLGRSLADPDSDVRWRAVQSLDHTRLKGAIPYLERAFTDSNPNIAAEARRVAEELRESGRTE